MHVEIKEHGVMSDKKGVRGRAESYNREVEKYHMCGC